MTPKPITLAEFSELAEANPYYVGRWSYWQHAIELAEMVRPRDILEIGPHERPLFTPCDTMDIVGTPTYLHDAGLVPWPWKIKGYQLIIGLQVWEHLDGRQRDAFQEACQCAEYLLLSFPLEWNVPADPIHHNITREQIDHWTFGRTPIEERVSDGPVKRLLRLWEC